MFEDSLYEIIARRKEAEKELFTIKINSDHEIFEGHFPDMPVMPGVCSLLIIKRLVSEIIGRQLIYSSIKDCKFISAILPDKCNIVEIQLAISKDESDTCKIVSELIYNGKTAIKLKAFMQ